VSANDPHPFDSTRQPWSSPYSAGGREHQGVLKVEGAVNEFHRAVAQGGGRLIEHRSREDLIIFVNYETRHSHRIRPVEFMKHDGNNEMIISHYAGRIMTPPDKLPLRAWWGSLHGEGRDAIVYLIAFVFSLGMGMLSKEPAQWHWGFISAGTYAVATTYSLLSGGAKRVPSHRTILAAFVFLGAVVVPLGLEVQWRHVGGTQQFAQPEVWVIEQSGQHVVIDGGPYVAFFSHGVLHGRVTGEPQYQAFFPYFPLMSVFGLPRALSPGQSQLTDARVVMSMATIVVMGLGLWFSRISRAKKLLVAQALCILPTGALFLSTGGDDMPILALGFLSLVVLERRQPLLLGVVCGIAVSTKLTAWPLASAVLLMCAITLGRRAASVALAATTTIFLGISLPYFVRSPRAFLENVFAFPLGLAGVDSPAASPLPGHLITSAWPVMKHILPVIVVLVGSYLLLRYLRRSPITSVSQTLNIVAVVALVVIATASATRMGYLIYPINYAVWASVFRTSTDQLILDA